MSVARRNRALAGSGCGVCGSHQLYSTMLPCTSPCNALLARSVSFRTTMTDAVSPFGPAPMLLPSPSIAILYGLVRGESSVSDSSPRTQRGAVISSAWTLSKPSACSSEMALVTASSYESLPH